MDFEIKNLPDKEYKQPQLEIDAFSYNGPKVVKPLHQEFFDELGNKLKQMSTLKEIEELAGEKALFIHEMERHPEQQKNLVSFAVYRLYDDEGNEFSEDELFVGHESKAWVGTITFSDHRKK